MSLRPKIQSQEDLKKLQEESEHQQLPEQKKVFTVSPKLRKRVHNLPDPARPPLGYDEKKAFDLVFPHINLPLLHPGNHGDTVIFNAPDLPGNKLIFGDNLQVLRTLPSDSIDLIYIDPPFFSGRNYNVIWGDTNEVRSFEDIWEGGLDSYLIWLNARLWEMRRVLRKTGSIYVHCDWHASHYIKAEMDKIFGYENFKNEIVWKRGTMKGAKAVGHQMGRNHDVILWYEKGESEYHTQYIPYREEYVEQFFRYGDEKGRFRLQPIGTRSKTAIENLRREGRIHTSKTGNESIKFYLKEMKGVALDDVWNDVMDLGTAKISRESIGYPTQKPEALLERIINASSDEGDVVADFFCGGGTTCAVVMKNKRRFIGCDSSRVAIAVTLDRLVKIGEEMSGAQSNVRAMEWESQKKDLFAKESFQMKLQTQGTAERVPNIEVLYHGVYPADKFKGLSHEDFIQFVLTCYGASHNTAEGGAHGFRPPGQSEPILIGPSDPDVSIDPKEIRVLFEEIKGRLEPNKPVRAKVIGWRFSKQVQQYAEMIREYVQKNKLFAEDGETPLMNIELITLRSKEFRQRILARYPDAEEADFYLRFPPPPVIGSIRTKRTGKLAYEFEVMDAFSSEEDGYLVNCQWDFDYQEGHFAADKDHILEREKAEKKSGHEFEAVLKAAHTFEKTGEYVVACKVQDNLAGEMITSHRISIT